MNKKITDIKRMVDDYILGINKEVHYGCNIMLDYLVFSSASWIYHDTYGLYSKEYQDLYDKYKFVEAKFLEEHQRIYNIVFSNTLTK